MGRLYTAIASIAVSGLFLLAMAAPSTASVSPPSLTVTLAPGQSVTEAKTVTLPSAPPKADIVFAFDCTQSMATTIDTAKAKATDIMNQLSATGVDIDYGVVSYMDYPHSYDSYGYSNEYGLAGADYAYRLNQPVTGDKAAVQNAISGLSLGGGSDGPQDYTRVFYESYSDPNIAWRPGAKRILVNFGDNVPHDNNLNEVLNGSKTVLNGSAVWSTGGDPGRDEVMFTADDLDLQAVLRQMADNRVTLLESHTADWYTDYGLMLMDYWRYWTSVTGGKAFITTSGTLVNDVVTNINGALLTPNVNGLTLRASPGYEAWVSSVSPASYTGQTGTTVNFNLVIQVPTGTPDGTYRFNVSAVDNTGLSYGDQSITVNVVSTKPSCTPKPSCSPRPTCTCSPKPTCTPIPACIKITGGGQIGTVGWCKQDSHSTFAFEASSLKGNTRGNLIFIDHVTGMMVDGNVTGITLNDAGTSATFTGFAKINGKGSYAYTVTVVDSGRGFYKSDSFSISIPGKPYAASGKVVSGNIMLH